MYYNDKSMNNKCKQKHSMTINEQINWKSITNPLADITWKTRTAIKVGDHVQWGVGMSGFCATATDCKINDATLYFNHFNKGCCHNGCTVGSEMNYDTSTKKFDCKMGL